VTVTIEVGTKPGVRDSRAESAARQIREHLGLPVRRVQVRTLYTLQAELEPVEAERAARELFADPVSQEFAVGKSLENEGFDSGIIVGFKPGVTDNVGRTASRALEELLGRRLTPGQGVFTATQYLLTGVDPEGARRVARELLANELIEDTEIQEYADWQAAGSRVPVPKPFPGHEVVVERLDLEVGDERLLSLSRERTLALCLAELKAVRAYFRRPEVVQARREVGLGPDPTDAELEALAQTWSEHCHHKVFNGIIYYTSPEGEKKTIRSLFRTYIRRLTEELDSPRLLSVFQDNAGVVRFNDRLALVYKVETHNSPSALDPYGGAMTGIVGVNRDPFGTGLGCRLIANVWGYCLGNPFHAGPLPQGLLHPRRVRDGVHRGVIEGGNQSGIPYLRGWELFEDRFMGKPLVFCGTLGEMPLEIGGLPAYLKQIRCGDEVVMVGGRVGKDGIHGATFSSEELHAASPVQAVQIGDPITQKKMTDMLLEARDRLLYRALTDNGAGGLSSSVGELALLAGGCEIDLARVPLKYQGLQPWEILVSEAQERMTLAVPPDKLQAYLELSARRGVESTPLGRFTASGKFHVRYGEATVAFLDLEFLHRGDPPYELEAVFRPQSFEEPEQAVADQRRTLLEMLGRLNVCSIEEKARQYDQEVQGRSVIKPFVGRRFDVPSDASVLLAEYGGLEGILLSEGINPFYSDIDTYWMAASAVDLAVRRAVAVGGELDSLAGLDNFCWPNVVKPGMPERAHKLAQLVRACEGLYDTCKAYRLPLISGKDSMSNDCTLTDPPISVPPTLLVSLLGRLPDVSRAVTLDPKAPGDLIYLLGETHEELGASEFFRYLGEKERGRAYIGNRVPKLDASAALELYRRLERAMAMGLVRSCHAPALGGLAVALAKMGIAGGLGLEVELEGAPGGAGSDTARLYSESNGRLLLTVAADKGPAFERVMTALPVARLGQVLAEEVLRIRGKSGQVALEVGLEELASAWKSTLREHRE